MFLSYQQQKNSVQVRVLQNGGAFRGKGLKKRVTLHEEMDEKDPACVIFDPLRLSLLSRCERRDNLHAP